MSNLIRTFRFGLNHELSHKSVQLFIAYYRFTRWIFGRDYHPFAYENYRQGFHPSIAFFMQIVDMSQSIFDYLNNMRGLSILAVIILLFQSERKLKIRKTTVPSISSIKATDVFLFKS